MKLSLLTATVILTLLGATPAGQPRGSPPDEAEEHHQTGEAATLTFWNREITVLRAYYEQLSPAQRAANAEARIEALNHPDNGWKVESVAIPDDTNPRILIKVNGQTVFGLLQEDLDPESGETLESAADHAVAQLGATLEAREQQQNWALLLRSIVLSIVAVLSAVFAVWLTTRAGRLGLSYLEGARDRLRPFIIGGINLRPLKFNLLRGAVRLAAWIAEFTIIYLCLTFVLKRFPYSQPWGDQLGAFLINFFERLGSGILQSIPGLFAVLVIFLLARIVVRLVSSVFREVEDRGQSIAWFHPDTARATRRLIAVLVWIFALIVAYPYIPGSGTDAFKGVSVFVGLMVSLGSAGLINQIMSGLVVIYSRALKPGEFVSIGDNEGLVSEVGMLSTKIITWKHEEVTIPNAVVVGTKTVNYSRLAGGNEDVVSTTVSIGYDTPWRQVHAMLLLAAERTEGVRKEPRPRVVQKELADFFVEYQLAVSLYIPEERIPVLSELHAHIQDVFNEFGVQIMAPHFQAQPNDRVFVPKSQWFTKPANSGQH